MIHELREKQSEVTQLATRLKIFEDGLKTTVAAQKEVTA